MNIEITEDRSRYKTTDYTWNVRIDGVLIAVAKTPGAGDRVANEVQARNDAAMLKQAISALDAVDQALTAELAHTYDDSPPQTQSEIMRGVVQAIWDDHDAQRDAECTINCPGCAYCEAERAKELSTARFAEDPCCPCGMPALFFVQYPGKTYAYSPDCYRELNASRPPLLAQCADVIRRCLGRTTGAGSIIDELRRVDQALRREGW